MRLLRKIHKYGYRRAFVYLLLTFICKVKCIVYRFILSDNYVKLTDSKVLQATQFIGRGDIRVFGASLGVWPSPYILSGKGYIEARSKTSLVEIGHSTFINNAFVIIADKTEIKIGKGCLIGPNFFVTDSDFHGIGYDDRCNGNYECAPVVIEDNVFIGDNVRILKGVRVGCGSVIGSGSVVVKDVEPMSVYAGVPARKIKDI